MGDFSEYKKVTEPDKAKKLENWRVAIGLQAVDGLTPSQYLIETAKQNIDGQLSIAEVYQRIDAYYKATADNDPAQNTFEADCVATRIAEILADASFSFIPQTLCAIHKTLFGDIYPKIAGQIRDYNISKDEPILDGATVLYGSSVTILAALKYDFDDEKNFDYASLPHREKIFHIAKFISRIWQTHPFAEGNTRTIAVFAIKYLRALGFEQLDNEMFEEHSKYFRNALVRANYQNIAKNISYTFEFLNKFFANLLLGEKYPLRNRDMQIDKPMVRTDSAPT
jgi:fido (protein-threonine AMPylation protein)